MRHIFTQRLTTRCFTGATIISLTPRPSRIVPNLQRSLHTTPPVFASRKKMPPKKGAKEEKVLLGRPSNNLKIGVVGLPNVG
jgi:hypothetical protein